MFKPVDLAINNRLSENKQAEFPHTLPEITAPCTSQKLAPVVSHSTTSSGSMMIYNPQEEEDAHVSAATTQRV